MVVFREANEYSGIHKCAYYVATMNACEGSGHTSEFQSGAHQVPLLGTVVTAGRQVLQPCSAYQTRAGPAPFPVAMCWDSHAAETPDSADGTGGAGGWVFQGGMFLATRGSTCGWHCFHALQTWLWTNWRLRRIVVWRFFILFLFLFILGSIITHSKHSEAGSRAILELQLGLSFLYALVHLYRVNRRLKQIKYSICLHCCFSSF